MAFLSNLNMNRYLNFTLAIIVIGLLGFVTFLPDNMKQILVSNIIDWLGLSTSDKTSFGFWLRNLNNNSLDFRVLINNLGHIIIFGLFGYTLGRYRKIFSKRLPFLLIIVFAGSSELLQYLVAGRQTDLEDLFLNIVAGFSGYVICQQIYFHRRPKF